MQTTIAGREGELVLKLEERKEQRSKGMDRIGPIYSMGLIMCWGGGEKERERKIK